MRQELPGLRGFGASNLKNMRLFYEAWYMIEPNSPIAIGELSEKTTEYAEQKDALLLQFQSLKVGLRPISWKSIPLNENYREALYLLGFSIIK